MCICEWTVDRNSMHCYSIYNDLPPFLVCWCHFFLFFSLNDRYYQQIQCAQSKASTVFGTSLLYMIMYQNDANSLIQWVKMYKKFCFFCSKYDSYDKKWKKCIQLIKKWSMEKESNFTVRLLFKQNKFSYTLTFWRTEDVKVQFLSLVMWKVPDSHSEYSTTNQHKVSKRARDCVKMG